jgi:hypothetical protein
MARCQFLFHFPQFVRKEALCFQIHHGFIVCFSAAKFTIGPLLIFLQFFFQSLHEASLKVSKFLHYEYVVLFLDPKLLIKSAIRFILR